MQFTTIKVEGIEFPVEVELDRDGFDGALFSTTVNGDEINSPTLNGLRRMLKDMIIASRIEVPYTDAYGTRGVMRGIHAGNRDILVTYSNGEKGRISGYERVYLEADAAAVDQARAEVRAAEQQLADANAHLKEALGPALDASDAFAAALGVDLLDWSGILERNAKAGVPR